MTNTRLFAFYGVLAVITFAVMDYHLSAIEDALRGVQADLGRVSELMDRVIERLDEVVERVR